MKVEIWSDIACPFCYLGKRKFDQALAQFPHADHIVVEWKSFQLTPDLKTDLTLDIHDFLCREKGIEPGRARQLHDRIAAMGAEIGLTYHFDTVVVANTFNAHRVIHFSKAHDKQNAMKERLLEAHFSEGKNMDDIPTLVELGVETGLERSALSGVLESDIFGDAVKADIMEGHQLGLRGVPFFVFDRKFAVSGAQETEVFLRAIEKSFAGWQQANPWLKTR